MIDHHAATRAARRMIRAGRVDEGLDALAALADARPSAMNFRILSRFAALAGNSDLFNRARERVRSMGIEGYADDLGGDLDPVFLEDGQMHGLLGFALRTPDLGAARLYMRWLRGRGDEARRILAARAERLREETDPRRRIVEHAACAYAAMSLGEADAFVEHAGAIDCDERYLELPPQLADFARPCLWASPRSLSDAAPIWSRRLRRPAPLIGDELARRPLVLVEGSIAPALAARMVAQAFPRARELRLSFLTRPPGMIEAFQTHFAGDARWTSEFPDLLIDYTGNYAPFIRAPSGLAGLVAKRAFAYLLRHVGPSEKALAQLFEEPLTLAFDDHIYRYLRVARALEGMYEAGGFDRVLVISATGTYLFAALTLARQQLGAEHIRFALVGRSPQMQERLAGLARRSLTGRLLAADAQRQPVALDAHRRRFSFSAAFGPVLTTPGGLRRTVARLAAVAGALRLSPSQWRRDRAACDLLETSARRLNAPSPSLEAFSGLTWIAANLDDRIYGPLAADLLRELAERSPIVFVDYAPPGSERTASVLDELEKAGRSVLVVNYRAVLGATGLSFVGLGRYRATPVSLLLPPGWRADFPLSIGETAMRHFLAGPVTSILRTVAPLHLRVGNFAWAAMRSLRAERLFIFPTRNTYMRVFAQGARLAGAPSFEIQTVLGGRMVRHFAPNTDLCSVLETWSRDYFVSYLGYPRERLLCGGSNRYDSLMRHARNALSDSVVRASARSAGAGDDRPFVLFGSQPMQMADNLAALGHVLDALAGRHCLQVVVKLHPAEPPANVAVYQAAARPGVGPPLSVVRDGDVYALIKGAAVVCAQTSNILIEAALLDRRAIALHFGDFDAPVEFEEMGCARMVRTPAELAAEMADTLDAPPGRARVDAMRAHFLADNPQMRDECFSGRIVEAGLTLGRRDLRDRLTTVLGDLGLGPDAAGARRSEP